MVAPRESRWARLVSGVVAAAAAAAGLADTKPSDNRKAARTGSTTHRRCLFVPKDPFISTYLLPVGGPTRPRDRVSADRGRPGLLPALLPLVQRRAPSQCRGRSRCFVWGRPW